MYIKSEKCVEWEDNSPTLEELIEVAKKEFPNIPFTELTVGASGFPDQDDYSAELWLRKND